MTSERGTAKEETRRILGECTNVAKVVKVSHDTEVAHIDPRNIAEENENMKQNLN